MWTVLQGASRSQLVIGMLALGLTGACASSTSANDDGCQVGTVVTISSGVSPMVRWTPACRIGALQVLAASNNLEMWTVTSRPQQGGVPVNLLASGITYGTVPPHGYGPIGALPLTSGSSYTVTIYVYPSGGAPVPVGHLDFVP